MSRNRCAMCGAPLYEGDEVVLDREGRVYCNAECYADATALPAVIGEADVDPYDEDAPVTYDEAVRLKRALDRLIQEMTDVARICRAAAAHLREEGIPGGAAYETAAEMVDEVLERVWPAALGSDTAGREMASTTIVPREGRL